MSDFRVKQFIKCGGCGATLGASFASTKTEHRYYCRDCLAFISALSEKLDITGCEINMADVNGEFSNVAANSTRATVLRFLMNDLDDFLKNEEK